MEDTIAAIATPIGTGGISIVKVSGPEALPAVMAVFKPRDRRRRLASVTSQRMIYGHIWDPEKNRLVDEVLVSVLKGPHSYTGEDVVEVNCHGGIIVTNSVLELLLQQGLRLADPGEFTRRAFMNGRIDLTQAEGTVDLIEAKTQRAARLSANMLHSGLGRRIVRLRDDIGELRARIEAAIDFCEEDDTDWTAGDVGGLLSRDVIPTLQHLLRGYREGRLLRQGMKVALAGRPNVGKSSLMNRLLQQDRVIVTEYPGTTRDTIEEGFVFKGLPIMISDTAGLRNAGDPVEALGQKKAREAIDAADLVLFMIDASQPVNEEDVDILNYIADRPYLLVRNKIDLVPNAKDRHGQAIAVGKGRLDISARDGSGIDGLKEKLLVLVGMEEEGESDGALPNLRQKELLRQALACLEAGLDQNGREFSLELVAEDLKDSERYLNEILGVHVSADVLDTIFSRFCIGK